MATLDAIDSPGNNSTICTNDHVGVKRPASSPPYGDEPCTCQLTSPSASFSDTTESSAAAGTATATNATECFLPSSAVSSSSSQPEERTPCPPPAKRRRPEGLPVGFIATCGDESCTGGPQQSLPAVRSVDSVPQIADVCVPLAVTAPSAPFGKQYCCVPVQSPNSYCGEIVIGNVVGGAIEVFREGVAEQPQPIKQNEEDGALAPVDTGRPTPSGDAADTPFATTENLVSDGVQNVDGPSSTALTQSSGKIIPYSLAPHPCLTSLLDGLLAEDVYSHIQAAFGISESWRHVLMPILCCHEGLRVIREYERRCAYETVLPPREDVFSWTRYCRPEDVKIIVVGQDPYHRVGQAHGLAFSVNRGAGVPPSLRNILMAVKRCYPDIKVSTHGNLQYWATQGVLLLNTVLTVKEGEPGSHTSVGWTAIVRSVLRYFENGPSGMVYLLWGTHAQRIHTPRTSRHLVLKFSHPSPLSRRPFHDCRHFIIANEYLTSMGKARIDWGLP